MIVPYDFSIKCLPFNLPMPYDECRVLRWNIECRHIRCWGIKHERQSERERERE